MYKKLNSLAAVLLPRWLYGRLIGSWDPNGFKKYFANTGWMLLGRVLTFVVSFFTITFVARYLGPENLGKLSYAQSLVALFSMIASLGIDQIVYRDLVSHPEREGEILGTAIVTKFVFGVIAFVAATLTGFYLNDEPLLTWLIGLCAFAFIVQPVGTVGHVFNARVLAKYTTIASLAIAIIVPILKLLVVAFDQGILYFAAIVAVEGLLYSLFNLFLYWYVLGGSWRTWRVRFNTFRTLFTSAWPLMFVGITGYLYARIDQVMLLHFIDSTAVGLYEAAVRLTEPLGFLPGIVMGSLFPALMNARKSDRAEYRRRLRSLATLALGTSSALALFIFILAPQLIALLYGPEFSATTTILRIYVWSTVGTIATMLMYNYFIAENKTYLQLIYTALGAVTNIILNYFLIPPYGAAGAATATLLTVLLIIGSFLLTSRWRQHDGDA